MAQPSPAERSAEQFGVKLRKVSSEYNVSSHSGNNSSSAAPVNRRSLPQGPPTRCESRLAQRRSAAAAMSQSSNKPEPKQSQVALRQELAEKQAIERRKASSNYRQSAGSSKSWEKKKPAVPTKPTSLRHLAAGLPKSSSCGAIAVTPRSSSVPPPYLSAAASSRNRRSGSQPPADTVVTLVEEEEKRHELRLQNLYNNLVSQYYGLRPILHNVYLHARSVLQHRSE